jgi:hypothetical protein
MRILPPHRCDLFGIRWIDGKFQPQPIRCHHIHRDTDSVVHRSHGNARRGYALHQLVERLRRHLEGDMLCAAEFSQRDGQAVLPRLLIGKLEEANAPPSPIS